MPGFLAKSACNGRRPSHLAPRRHYPRPDIIARLLRERHVARFLVAPDGFGKSGVAMEYADMVFSFDHTFWINGRSPCFLRDLDRGIIASTLAEIDGHAFLAVVEDVPPLDPARAAALSAVFDELLDGGNEVLATCCPSCDAYASLQHDRVRLGPSDLLLTDAEVEAAASAGDRAARPAASVPASERVPALRWGGAEGEAAFLAGTVREELPADMLLAVSTMLVLRTGAVSDAAVFGPCGDELVALLAAGYPHLGIDRRGERFAAPAFAAEPLAAAIEGKLDSLAARSRFADRDQLVVRWADALGARSEHARACELVGALCSREARADWLASRSRALMRGACIMPGHKLYGSLGTHAVAANPRLELGEAVRLALLGDDAAALARVRRLAFDLNAPEGVRALASLLIARRGQGAARDHAADELARLVGAGQGAGAGRPRSRPGATSSVGAGPDEAFWRPLATAQLAIMRDPAWLAQDALAPGKGVADEDALALADAWALSEIAEGRMRVADDPACDAAAVRIERCVRKRLSRLDGAPCDLFAAFGGLALERAREAGALSADRPLGAAETLALHRAEMEMLSQRRAYERTRRERAERQAERAATHPDAYLDGRYLPERQHAANIAPLLTVNLFGGLDVRIGGEPVDMNRFRRQKVKTLLALLVLNRGREFPRDKLVSALWPTSGIDTARKNFYSTWSQLRRTLAAPSGACPYLVRHQNGCRLDERLLVSDVERFDAVCRMLLFGQPGSDGWAQLYAEIDGAFADDLLPSEQDNELIVQAREDRRVQLVDALVAAAGRLVASDDAQEGLWFARAALRRDRTREDAYAALMRAQIASGQRTAALETYFACRRFLTTELGIDPSLATMELYRSIIESEEPMD